MLACCNAHFTGSLLKTSCSTLRTSITKLQLLLGIGLEHERRVERERKKEETTQKKAEAQAEKQRKKEACDAAKSIQLTQLGKRKASQMAPTKPRKMQKRAGGAVGSFVAAPPTLSPPPNTTRRGRNVHLPSKYKYRKLIASFQLLLQHKFLQS
ncbi:hypothetical protein BU25DRAFT_426496 [Macroventuria anomochaeta]|uniref:Uncharacterized protein n=1 Tax=Macroventuria anomochaeta TaxID=301207 RepID=A0ACB6RJ85_9PLEO|nr:uncharacterized protein BU25DRAFT_426496 [Macroventuria anomochaeta]KAF2621475.1 hypothetical protein BU25DRAFT_426496 [Macroventuria anomochaeta]